MRPTTQSAPACTPSRAGCRRGSAPRCRRARTPSPAGTPTRSGRAQRGRAARGRSRTGACTRRAATAPPRRGSRTRRRARRDPRTRTETNGMSPEIGPIKRVVGSRLPPRLASHGGAAGKSAKVDEPIPASSGTRHIASEPRAVERTRAAPRQIGRHEVAHVDRPGREVVPAQCDEPCQSRSCRRTVGAVPLKRNSSTSSWGDTRPRRGGRRLALAGGRRGRARARTAATRGRRPAPSRSRFVVESASRPSRIQTSSRSRPTGIALRHMYALSAAT